MNTNKKDSFNKASVIIALSIILGTVAYAWTPAPANPPANNVPAPINAGDSEQTKGGPVIFNGSFNPVRISNVWTNFAKAGAGEDNHAEIANDINAPYNALMIAGNKSGDHSNRKVKLYDDVDVAQNLNVGNAVKIGTTAASCSPANEGSVRYNSTIKKLEFCDGTTWTVIGGSIAAAPEIPPLQSCIKTFSVPGAYDCQIPVGKTSINLKMVGGGGGGGSGSGDVSGIGGSNSQAGYGGGASPYITKVISVTPGQIIHVIVGAGGLGQTGYGAYGNGGTGGKSSIDAGSLPYSNGGGGGSSGGWGGTTPGSGGTSSEGVTGGSAAPNVCNTYYDPDYGVSYSVCTSAMTGGSNTKASGGAAGVAGSLGSGGGGGSPAYFPGVNPGGNGGNGFVTME